MSLFLNMQGGESFGEGKGGVSVSGKEEMRRGGEEGWGWIKTKVLTFCSKGELFSSTLLNMTSSLGALFPGEDDVITSLTSACVARARGTGFGNDDVTFVFASTTQRAADANCEWCPFDILLLPVWLAALLTSWSSSVPLELFSTATSAPSPPNLRFLRFGGAWKEEGKSTYHSYMKRRRKLHF